MLHAVKIIGFTAGIMLCMFIPFFPGSYDSLAITLSFMAQLSSYAGLSLVPIGFLWFLELKKQDRTQGFEKGIRRFILATVVTLGFVVLVGAFGAWSGDNYLFGGLFLASCLFLLVKKYIKIQGGSITDGSPGQHTPLYLIIIPLLLVFAQWTFITPAVDFSRSYAIKKSGKLIQAIEAYHQKHGSYPTSLQALHSDYSPSVIGIAQYNYEPNGNAYNLYFKQFSEEWDVEEIVMYNKLDEHAFAAHAMDILEYSGGELSLRRGDRHRYKLLEPHWIYFKFD